MGNIAYDQMMPAVATKAGVTMIDATDTIHAFHQCGNVTARRQCCVTAFCLFCGCFAADLGLILTRRTGSDGNKAGHTRSKVCFETMNSPLKTMKCVLKRGILYLK